MSPGEQLFIALANARTQAGGVLNRVDWIATADKFIASIKPARKPAKALETDAQWVESLEADPALKGLNVRREIERCALWYAQNVSKTGKPSRRRITNWLLKAEKIVDLKGMGAQHATGLKIPAPDGPEGWLVWLNTELSLISEDHPAHGQLLFALNSRKFSGLPVSWQVRCKTQLQA